MKTKNKALLLALCAVMLVVASVLGTLAYLTYTTEVVKNTFTVGKVEITLDEADVDNSTANKDRDTANSYKLIPGHTYVKDPTVHVAAGSEDCWLFVKVVNGISNIEANGEGVDTIAEQMAANGWTLVGGETDVYAHASASKAGDNVVVFSNFTVSGSVDETTLRNGAGDVTVTAYAVQAENFDTAAEAWEAAPAEWKTN